VFPLLQDNPSQLVSRGEQYCPRVEVLPRELYVPNNVPQELSLTLTNLPPDLLAAAAPSPPQFLCQVPPARNIKISSVVEPEHKPKPQEP
jgi:hypothetical protein